MKQREEESSQTVNDELPIQYYLSFYYIPNKFLTLYNNKILLSDANLNVVQERPIAFDLQPCVSRCSFADAQYSIRNDNLLDVPQLYKVFQVGNNYYAQILDYIVKITLKDNYKKDFYEDNVVQVTPLLKFMNNKIETPELTYARVAKLTEKELIFTIDGFLFTYDVQNNTKNKIKIKTNAEKHDFMVFSYKNTVIVFDTLTNYVYKLEQKGQEYEIHFLFETEGQELIFQNKYIILSDGEQPKPLIEIIDISTQKLYSCSQNWFQDNFWSWLKVVKGEIEVDEEVEIIVKKLINGEKVDFMPANAQSDDE